MMNTPLATSRLLLLVAACMAVSCSNREPAGASPSDAAAAAADPLALAVPSDLDPDPNVLHVRLEAKEGSFRYSDGQATPVWTFGETIPGPLLDAKVGDRVIIDFTNRLPEPTTIHWHGIRLPAAMDGSVAMQDPIPPGASFRYEFTLKDAGLFWYHPHVRSDVQVQKGLYGAFRVRGAGEPVVDEERVVVLDDVRLKDDGTLSEYLDDTTKMMGREGNTFLLNGVANAALPVQAGSLVRLRLVNVANGRFFNLRLPGHTWRVIGTDGGLIEQPYDTEKLLISPGERYDVLLVPTGAPGDSLDLVNEPYERGHETGNAPAVTVARVVFRPDAALTGRALPSTTRTVPAIDAASITIPLVLNEGVQNGELAFTVNGAVYPQVPMVSVPLGQSRLLDITNESEMDHPFHLHGFFFQALEQNGVALPLARMGNKDTIIVPAKARLKLVSTFDEPGMWMYHCHILEHAEGGMMGEIHVE